MEEENRFFPRSPYIRESRSVREGDVPHIIEAHILIIEQSYYLALKSADIFFKWGGRGDKQVCIAYFGTETKSEEWLELFALTETDSSSGPRRVSWDSANPVQQLALGSRQPPVSVQAGG